MVVTARTDARDLAIFVATTDRQNCLLKVQDSRFIDCGSLSCTSLSRKKGHSKQKNYSHKETYKHHRLTPCTCARGNKYIACVKLTVMYSIAAPTSTRELPVPWSIAPIRDILSINIFRLFCCALHRVTACQGNTGGERLYR